MTRRFTRLDAIDRLMDNSKYNEIFRDWREGRISTHVAESMLHDMECAELESLEEMEAESRGELRRHLNVAPVLAIAINQWSKS